MNTQEIIENWIADVDLEMSYVEKVQIKLAYQSGFQDGYGGINNNPFSDDDHRYDYYEKGNENGKSCRFDVH